MGKWDNTPSDILEKILQHVKVDKNLHRCLLVNMQWLLLAQMKIYAEIKIAFDDLENSRMFKTLVKSKFQPGAWVKNIYVVKSRKTFANTTKKQQ